jgi:hypothetical protein
MQSPATTEPSTRKKSGREKDNLVQVFSDKHDEIPSRAARAILRLRSGFDSAQDAKCSARRESRVIETADVGQQRVSALVR